MQTLTYVVMAFGAVVAACGIVLFAKKGNSGDNTVKMLGFEFQLSGSSLVIFVVGSVIFLVPIIYREDISVEPLGAVLQPNGEEGPFTKTTTVDAENDMVNLSDPLRQSWKNTGITLTEEDLVEVTATNATKVVCWGDGFRHCNGPDGSDVTCGESAEAKRRGNQEPKCGALIAKVGEGNFFAIGSSSTITGRSGDLFLGYSDLDIGGNSGAYKVVIKKTSN